MPPCRRRRAGLSARIVNALPAAHLAAANQSSLAGVAFPAGFPSNASDRVRKNTNFARRFKPVESFGSELAIFLFRKSEIYDTFAISRLGKRDVCASSRNVRRDAMDAAGNVRRAMPTRTVKSCGPGTPGLVLSARVMIRA